MNREAKQIIAVPVVIGVVGFVLTVSLGEGEVSADWGVMFRGATAAVTVGGLAYAAVASFLWKRFPLHGQLSKTPRIEGEWTGESIRENTPDRRPRTARMIISQPLMNVVHCVFEHLDESVRSDSANMRICESSSGCLILSGFFLIKKRPETATHDGTHDIYRGAVWLRLGGPSRLDPTEMVGEYWTTTGTKGTLRLRRAETVSSVPHRAPVIADATPREGSCNA